MYNEPDYRVCLVTISLGCRQKIYGIPAVLRLVSFCRVTERDWAARKLAKTLYVRDTYYDAGRGGMPCRREGSRLLSANSVHERNDLEIKGWETQGVRL